MRKLTKVFLSMLVVSLACFAVTFNLNVKADDSVVTVNSQDYTLADSLTELDFFEANGFQSTWGNQEATIVYNQDGTITSKANQRIDQGSSNGSYHTKFNIKVDSGTFMTFMLRNYNEDETKVVGGKTIYDGKRNGYELFTSDNAFTLYENTNDARVAINWFQYSDKSLFTAGNSFDFEIWVLDLKDGSIQLILNVDGVNKMNINTATGSSYIGTDTSFTNIIHEGGIRFGAVDCGAQLTFSPVVDKSNIKVNNTSYSIADSLTEFDFLKVDNMMSRWGNQPATVSYDATTGTMTSQGNQRIDQTSSNGSYHTKFRMYLATKSANFMTIMLRQNSGTTTVQQSKTLDNGSNNGYEIFTSDNGFQFFDVRNGTRSDNIKWFAYDTDNTKFASGEAFYDFEIWVLNLKDGSIQFIINVDGANKLTLNTSESTKFGEPILEGGIRFGADDSTMKTIYTEYGTAPLDNSKDAEGNYKLADALYELTFGKEENFLAAWGNQAATVTFDSENTAMTCMAYQQINSVVDTGSYHTKFKMTIESDNTNWVSLMLRQSIRTAVSAGVCGARNGYGLFFADGGIQFMKWTNDSAAQLAWFRFEPSDANYGSAVKTIGNEYVFEIWVLNLENGTVQFIISVNDQVVFNDNSKSLGDSTPILNGYFRISEPGSSFKATYAGYTTVTATTTVTGEPDTTYIPTDSIDVSGLKAITKYGEVVGASYSANELLVSGLNLRQVGEQAVKVNFPNLVKDYTFTVSKIEGATYAVKAGYKANYLVGDAFADDIIVTRTVGSTVDEIKVLTSEITGFDTTTSGNKTLVIILEGETINVTIEVAAYAVKTGYKANYLKGDTFADDIKVVKTVGTTETEMEVSLDDITGFDTTTTGSKTLTFTKVVDFTITIEVAEYFLGEEYKANYLVGETFADDIVVTKVVGDSSTNVEVAVTGFDTTTSGIKEVTITAGDFTQTVEIEVAEFVLKTGFKTEYFVGDVFAEDIKVVRKVGSLETNLTVTVTGFDSTTAGTKELTITAGGKIFNASVVISNMPEDKKAGCGSNMNSVLAILGLAAVIFFARKKITE